MVAHDFQGTHHCAVTPCLAAVSGAGVEQLLRGGGVGQRQADGLGGLQGQVQVLLVQFNAEARIEGALDHALAVHFPNLGSSEAAHQCGRDRSAVRRTVHYR